MPPQKRSAEGRPLGPKRRCPPRPPRGGKMRLVCQRKGENPRLQTGR
ncbi:hypothetical protein HMPREF0262_03721 [Clostridium sp. ATCC 29733]|nr:hypothetical protein HMPREF0262_03721 [Clostridium sp. ATCC 29733]